MREDWMSEKLITEIGRYMPVTVDEEAEMVRSTD